MRFPGDLAAGDFVPEPVGLAAWLRIAELVAAYRDLPPTVEASIVGALERRGAGTIGTLDRPGVRKVHQQRPYVVPTPRCRNAIREQIAALIDPIPTPC